MESYSQRIDWADYAKAIAIWLMVVCHFGLRPWELSRWIYIFHMPAFFFVSGYLDKGAPLTSALFKKYFRQILVPYFFFSVCALSACWIAPYYHPDLFGGGSVADSFVRSVVGILLMDNTVRSYSFMPEGALWFLVALFEVKIVFALMCRCWEKCKVLVPVILLGLLVVFRLHIPFFTLDSAAMAVPVYAAGYFFRRFDLIERVKGLWACMVVALVLWLYMVFVAPLNGNVSMNMAFTGRNAVMFYVNGIIGSLALIFTCRIPRREIRVLSVVGICTLTILATHGYVIRFAKLIAVYGLGTAPGSMPMWFIVVFSFVALACGVWIHKFLESHLAWSVGRSRDELLYEIDS